MTRATTAAGRGPITTAEYRAMYARSFDFAASEREARAREAARGRGDAAAERFLIDDMRTTAAFMEGRA